MFDLIAIDDAKQEAALPNNLVAPEHVTGDLSSLVLGAFDDRKTADECTAFVFRGHALGNLALASLLALQKFHKH